MGLAYASLNQHAEAVSCYKKAVQLEPDNESYQSNLLIAEEKLIIGRTPKPNPIDEIYFVITQITEKFASTQFSLSSISGLTRDGCVWLWFSIKYIAAWPCSNQVHITNI